MKKCFFFIFIVAIKGKIYDLYFYHSGTFTLFRAVTPLKF